MVTQNIDGTVVLLEAVRRADGVERLLYTDSENEFGRPMSLAIDESHPLTSQNPYGFSKAVELAVWSWHRAYGVQWCLQGWESRPVGFLRSKHRRDLRRPQGRTTGPVFILAVVLPIQWMRATGSRFSRPSSTIWWRGLPEPGIAA